MKKLPIAILYILLLVSCANSYNITGTTNVSGLDGRKLYLKVLKDTVMKNLDSCDVVHGHFHFAGTIDSARVGNIYVSDISGLPVVLEGGDITVKIDNSQESVTGTPLNDKLTDFRVKFNQLQRQLADLVHQHDQAIMEGKDMAKVTARLNDEQENITEKMDKLVTDFVTDNFDNVLGPYVFIQVCISRYEVPMLDAWVEDIWSKATPAFKGNAQVKEYYEAAQANQEIMNGMRTPAPAPPTASAPAPAAPTPNELAAPADSQ